MIVGGVGDAVRLFDAGARGDPAKQRVHDRVFTAANAITFVRLAGLPLFAWLILGPERHVAAFWVLVVVGTTDWVDGYVARRFDQVTRLGKVMDPIIDRAMLATASVTLLVAGLLPWPVVALIVARDALLLGAAFALFGRIPPIPVSRTGKFATACLLIGVPAFVIGDLGWPLAVAWPFTVIGLVGYYVGGVQYARSAWRLKRVL